MLQTGFVLWVKLLGFGGACLSTAILLRFWVRGHPEGLDLRTGMTALALAGVWGWWVLMKWRYRDPELAYTLLGVCAAVGGAGMYVITSVW